MGVSTDGILCYGVDLGEGFDELEPCPFLDAVEERDEEEDFSPAEFIVDILIEAAGFTELDPFPGEEILYEPGAPDYDKWAAWYGRKLDAEKALPVEVVTHCSDGCPMYILAARPVIQNARGYPETINPADLVGREEAAKEAVARALETLGMKPKNTPGWLLASYWG